MAQEILGTFERELSEVALIPGSGGVFDIHTNGTLIWSRKAERGFPEIKELKQRIRDVVAPGRDLGHLEDSEEMP